MMKGLTPSSTSAEFNSVGEPWTFAFPADHGEHRDFRNEWWYLTLILNDSDGREFGAQYTLFRHALTPELESDNPWRSSQIYMAHFAIADVEAQTHNEYEYLSRGHPRLAGVDISPFSAYLASYELKSTGREFFPQRLTAREQDIAIDVTLKPTKPIVLHGSDGLSRKAEGVYSYYYSIPRVQATGTLTTGDQDFDITGTGWLDREWHTSVLSERHRGWDWFALQFDSGIDLVLFRLRLANAEAIEPGVGLFIDAEGSTESLLTEQWQLTPTRYWQDWPVEWQLHYDNRLLTISAAFDDQLMRTSVVYWEGLVYVREHNQRIGAGYMELTGY